MTLVTDAKTPFFGIDLSQNVFEALEGIWIEGGVFDGVLNIFVTEELLNLPCGHFRLCQSGSGSQQKDMGHTLSPDRVRFALVDRRLAGLVESANQNGTAYGVCAARIIHIKSTATSIRIRYFPEEPPPMRICKCNLKSCGNGLLFQTRK